MAKPPEQNQTSLFPEDDGVYSGLVIGIVELLDAARKSAARSVNSIMTATTDRRPVVSGRYGRSGCGA